MNDSLIRRLALAFLVTGLAACSNEEAAQDQVAQVQPAPEQLAQERLVPGDCQSVFDGEICTWSKMLGDELVEFGATVPLATVENAELTGEFVFPPITLARISLPKEVTERTGVDHLGVNWEVHGHPPGPFLTPHFDFHFYMINGAEVEAIDCSDLSKPEALPVAYVLPDLEIPELGTLVGICVPQMGMHALDEAEINATELFGATMVVGYYARDIIFIEPMIARDKLLKREDFTLHIPSLSGRGTGIATPSGFKATYDEQAQAYQFKFSMTPAE